MKWWKLAISWKLIQAKYTFSFFGEFKKHQTFNLRKKKHSNIFNVTLCEVDKMCEMTKEKSSCHLSFLTRHVGDNIFRPLILCFFVVNSNLKLNNLPMFLRETKTVNFDNFSNTINSWWLQVRWVPWCRYVSRFYQMFRLGK